MTGASLSKDGWLSPVLPTTPCLLIAATAPAHAASVATRDTPSFTKIPGLVLARVQPVPHRARATLMLPHDPGSEPRQDLH